MLDDIVSEFPSSFKKLTPLSEAAVSVSDNMGFFICARVAAKIKDAKWIFLTDECYPLDRAWSTLLETEAEYLISDKLNGPGVFSKFLMGEHHNKLYNMAGSQRPFHTSLNPDIVGNGEKTNLIDNELTADTLLLFGEKAIELLLKEKEVEDIKVPEPVVEEPKVEKFLPPPESSPHQKAPANVIPLRDHHDTLKADFPCYVIQIQVWNAELDTWDTGRFEMHCEQRLAQVTAWGLRRIGYNNVKCWERETEITVPIKEFTNMIQKKNVSVVEALDIPLPELKWDQLKRIYVYLREKLGVNKPQLKRRIDIEMEVAQMKKIFKEESVGRERMVQGNVFKHG